MAIRNAKPEDVAQMLAIYAPFVTDTTVSFETEVPTKAEFSARMAAYTLRCPWLVWEEDGRVLGYAYGHPAFERAAYDWCAEVSIYLAPEARGRGVGRALYTRLEALLQRQGYLVLYAVITGENGGSVAFHQQLGYNITAFFPKTGYKMGRWIDTVWMEKRLPGPEHPQQPPIDWPALPHNETEDNP